MRDSIRPKHDEAVEKYEKLIVEEKALHSELLSFIDNYKSTYKFDLNTYKEFVDNEYIDGIFYSHAKGLFINKKHNYTATNALYKLYKFARMQKELHDLKHQIDVWSQMINIKLDDYNKVLEAFYTEVHKKMIIEGYGYVFENPIGWICINRCKIDTKRKMLDFKATKENKTKLIAEGKKLYNKEEANYAAKIGADYNGVDYRVYKNEEYCYEIPLFNCRIHSECKLHFEPARRDRGYWGKDVKEVVEENNSDLNKICELPIGITRKLYACLEADDILYLNFIRNENQKSSRTVTSNRKDRQ